MNCLHRFLISMASAWGFFCMAASPSLLTGEESLNWDNWRGPHFSGTVAQGKFSVSFNAKNCAWKTELPGKGSSTPIVWQGRIYLTAPNNGMDSVLCYDSTGKQIWNTTFGQEDPGKHANASGSNASPVTDGQGVFVYFKSGTFAALNLDGSIRWQRDIVAEYGKEIMYWDNGNSPVLTQDFVVIVRMHAGDSWIAAFRKSDGQLAWKTDRTFKTPVENDQCYTTPLVIQHQGQEAILTWGAERITIHSASQGRLLWSCGNFNPDGNRLWPAIASPVVVGDMAIVAHGRNDRGNPLLFGVSLVGSGDVTETNHVWKRTDVGTFVPTPIVLGKELLVLGDQGEVESIDATTGKTVWQARLPKNRHKYYSSPLLAGNRLIAAREDGVVFVAEIEGDQFELKSENDMEESVIGSPVPLGDGLLIRGVNHLFYVAPQSSIKK